MKISGYTAILMAMCMFPIAIDAQEELPETNIQSQPTDTLIYTVYGMDCPGCEGGLEKQVNKIPSIKFSEANWVKQELKLVLKEGSSLDKKELKKRVQKANFTLAVDAKKDDDKE